MRIITSLRVRSFKTNCSTWYLAPTQVSNEPGKGSKLSGLLVFKVLKGKQKKSLHHWLFSNRSRYPWVYFPDEIESSSQFEHWYPAIFNGNSLVAWIKLARTTVFIHDFEVSVTLPSDVAFIYDTFVDPDYRRQGLGQLLIEHAKSFLATEGYPAVACHIEDWNDPSIKTFKATGFKPMGQIRYFRLTFFRFLIIDNKLHQLSALTNWLHQKKLNFRLNN